jgi:aminoglycoside 6'-N-acetyltransferase
MFLKGNRVSIRPVRREDLPSVCKWWNNPTVMREVRAEKFSITLEQLRRQYWSVWRNPRPDQYHEFVVCFGQQVIGEIGYRFEDIDRGVLSVDIKIGEPGLWNRGFGTEAMQLFLSYLFDRVKAKRIIAQPGDLNVRSMRMLEKCCFVEISREEISPTDIHDGGVMVTMVLERESFAHDKDAGLNG